MITKLLWRLSEKLDKLANLMAVKAMKKVDSKDQKGIAFKDKELRYSSTAKCPCGAGLAYPKNCSPSHYWDCSAILTGIANKDTIHSAQYPFAYSNIKSESPERGTTRIGKRFK